MPGEEPTLPISRGQSHGTSRVTPIKTWELRGCWPVCGRPTAPHAQGQLGAALASPRVLHFYDRTWFSADAESSSVRVSNWIDRSKEGKSYSRAIPDHLSKKQMIGGEASGEE